MESLYKEPYKIESKTLFAGGENARVSEISEDGSYVNSENVKVTTDLNYQEGIPVRFSQPPGGGGEYLRRGMLNAIGKMASAAPFYMGIGYMYTFEKDIAKKIGGYPKGAILRYTDANGRSHLVESLIPNNDVDFTEPMTSEENAPPRGPDGSSWAVITGGNRSFFVNWGSLKVCPLTISQTTADSTRYTPITTEVVVQKDSIVYSGNLNFSASASGTGIADLAVCIKTKLIITITKEDGTSEDQLTELWVPIATAAWWSSETAHAGRIYSSGGVFLKAGTSICVCAIGKLGGLSLIPATPIPGAIQNYDNSFLCFELAEV